MELHIDTSKNEYALLSLYNEGVLCEQIRFEAKYKQSERLLIKIEELLKKANLPKKDIKKIVVVDEGEGFSSLRIGVLTANALAYALGVEVISEKGENIKDNNFKMVKPSYSSEPNIG